MTMTNMPPLPDRGTVRIMAEVTQPSVTDGGVDLELEGSVSQHVISPRCTTSLHYMVSQMDMTYWLQLLLPD